jgi:hypothetical protein
MKTWTFTLLMAAAMPLLFACNKKDDPSPSGGGDTHVAMTWTDGGTTYTASLPTSARSVPPQPQFFMITGISNGSLTALPSLTLTIHSTTVGTVSLNSTASNDHVATYLTLLGDYSTDRPGGSGTVTITSVDWRNGGAIKGTFNLVVANDDGATRTLSGSFDTTFPLN